MYDTGHQSSQRSHLFVLDQLRLNLVQLAITVLQIIVGPHQRFGHRCPNFRAVSHPAKTRNVSRSWPILDNVAYLLSKDSTPQ